MSMEAVQIDRLVKRPQAVFEIIQRFSLPTAKLLELNKRPIRAILSSASGRSPLIQSLA